MDQQQLDNARHSECLEENSATDDREAQVKRGARKVRSATLLPDAPAHRRYVESRVDARRKNDWIATLGHELRNPVGAIGTGLELVRTRSSESEVTAVVGMMQRQVEQIVVVLDGLLDSARLTAGKLEIRHEPVDLVQVASDALETARRLVEERGHELSVTMPPAGTVSANGDRVRLVGALVNVLANAAKYTPPGGRVELEVSAEPETALIAVRDTGIGIAKDFVPHVFELFSQGERAFDGKDRGLGLGLCLARSLVQLHGGDISAFSDGEGRGSEFVIRLPRLGHELASGSTAVHRAKAVPIAASRRILIVEDEPDQLEWLQELLEGRGHATRGARNGPAALVVARPFLPEAALIDVGLPGMGGYELAHLLREQLPNLQMIAVTGYRKGFGGAGSNDFDHHVIKPIDFERLSALLARPS